jgi:UDP-glucose 4-epimerase
MRIVVTGATGNVGVRVVDALARRDDVEEVVGVARRQPELEARKTRFVAADIRHADLVSLFAGADAVVHLAWMIQPAHDERTTSSTNVAGSRRVAQAAIEAGVPALVHASSIGAYAPGPKRPVDESWPATASLRRSTRATRRPSRAFSRTSLPSIPRCASSYCDPA